jgi:hypothetical protein
MFGGVEAAWRLAAAETQSFLVVLNHLEQVPVLDTYWNTLSDIKQHSKKDDTATSVSVQEKKWWAPLRRKNAAIAKTLSSQRSLAMLKNTQAENPALLVRKVKSFSDVTIQFSEN